MSHNNHHHHNHPEMEEIIVEDIPRSDNPKRLSFTDRYLTVWILGAIILGVLIGYFSPESADNIDSWSTGNVNWPIAIGLIVMMFPPLARVNYDRVYVLLTEHLLAAYEVENYLELARFLVRSDPKCGPKCCCNDPATTSNNDLLLTNQKGNNKQREGNFKGLMLSSLFLNWIVGPLLMFFLAIACLPDKVPYIRGLILIGLARCIAMVIVWNDLASGSREYCAVLVSLNSLFQIITYSPFAYILISLFLPAFHLPHEDNDGNHISVSFELVVESVAIYLGIPFLSGISCWLLFNKFLNEEWSNWYKKVFIPYTSPLTLIALLFTIIVMFCLKGRVIVTIPLDVLRVAIPLCLYFTIMFVGTYYLCHRFQFHTGESITLAFTSASNNFELAIAVSVAMFGLDSPEAFAGVIGPLVEVPVMLGFVYLVRYLETLWPTVKSSSSGFEEIHQLDEEIAEKMKKDKKKILFFCNGNSCRSQMALAWCQFYHSNELIGYSAGRNPTPGHPGSINPHAIQVLMEYGIDIHHFTSKHYQDLQDISFDVVVTVCDSICPAYKPSKVHDHNKHQIINIHQLFDDPPQLETPDLTEEEKLSIYRRVCEEIKYFIRDELKNLIHEQEQGQRHLHKDEEEEESIKGSDKRLVPVSTFDGIEA